MESGGCPIPEGSARWGLVGHLHYAGLGALVNFYWAVTIPMLVCLARLRVHGESHSRGP